MSVSVVIAIVGLVLGVGSGYLQEVHSAAGNNLKKKAEALARKIYSKIANNTKALEKLQTAIQERNVSLANAVFSQAGFGPAVSAIQKEYSKNLKEVQEAKEKTSDENTQLQNEYNKLTNAAYQTGTIAGNKYARETYNQVGQAVEGGLEDYEHHDINPSGSPFTMY